MKKDTSGREMIIHAPLLTREIMGIVLIALVPMCGTALYFFGMQGGLLLASALGGALAAEILTDLVTRRFHCITDGTAAVTGLITGLLMPPGVPLWMPAAAAAAGIVIAKALFGGTGRNFLNPAMTGKLILLLAFQGVMRDYSYAEFSSITPLTSLAEGNPIAIRDMILGGTSGCIGLTTPIPVLAGALVLMAAGITDIMIPLAAVLFFSGIMLLFGSHGADPLYVLAEMLGGGFLFAAFFMLQDTVTSPVSRRARFLYGALFGIAVAVLRIFGIKENAVTFALPAVNLLARPLDEMMMPQPFGTKRMRSRRVLRGRKDEQEPEETEEMEEESGFEAEENEREARET